LFRLPLFQQPVGSFSPTNSLKKMTACMKPISVIIALAVGSAFGFGAGSFLTSLQNRNAVLAGPYSDNLIPAHLELERAKSKLRAGDTNIIEHLEAADAQIENAIQWSKHFTGLKDGNAH
jgi:hypothetical protein